MSVSENALVKFDPNINYKLVVSKANSDVVCM